MNINTFTIDANSTERRFYRRSEANSTMSNFTKYQSIFGTMRYGNLLNRTEKSEEIAERTMAFHFERPSEFEFRAKQCRCHAPQPAANGLARHHSDNSPSRARSTKSRYCSQAECEKAHSNAFLGAFSRSQSQTRRPDRFVYTP